jgi:hypothetical protein
LNASAICLGRRRRGGNGHPGPGFGAANRSGEKVLVDADFVERLIGDLAANADLSRFIL